MLPPYLTANKSLETLVRFTDGVPSGKMVGKQPAPATLQARSGAMSCSPAALPATSHLVWTPWLVTLIHTALSWMCITMMQYFTPEVMLAPANVRHQATTTVSSDPSTPNSTSSDISNGAHVSINIEEQAAPSEDGQGHGHECDCADSNSSNMCLLGASCSSGCKQLAGGEQACTCACSTCKVRNQRI